MPNGRLLLAAAVLAAACAGDGTQPAAGPSLWLDRDGSIFLWRPGSAASTRVRLADPRWRVDSLAGVSSAGAIAAHGVDPAGRGAALLLAPASR